MKLNSGVCHISGDYQVDFPTVSTWPLSHDFIILTLNCKVITWVDLPTSPHWEENRQRVTCQATVPYPTPVVMTVLWPWRNWQIAEEEMMWYNDQWNGSRNKKPEMTNTTGPRNQRKQASFWCVRSARLLWKSTIYLSLLKGQHNLISSWALLTHTSFCAGESDHPVGLVGDHQPADRLSPLWKTKTQWDGILSKLDK